MSFLLFIVIGAIAGWLAGQMMRGSGYGLFTNIFLGVLGSVIGGWIFDLFNVDIVGKGGAIISATIGALIILLIAKKLKG